MILSDALKKLKELQIKAHAYEHAMGMLSYDALTAAPSDSAEGRGMSMGILSEEYYKIMVNDETGALLDFLWENREGLSEHEKREVELLKKEYDHTRKIPMDEYTAYTMLLNDADVAWHRAKETDDYELFKPYLKKLIDYNKKMAHYYDPEKEPYDVLLDLYEEGLTKKDADRFFDTVKATVVPLLHEIMKCDEVDDSFLYGKFDINTQREFSQYLMDVLTIDKTHCVIAETEHPFTTNFNRNDVRITTKYHEDNAVNSMYSVIHEGGHALYELGMDSEHDNTVVAGGVSMGIHESQSRFMENLIGRSREFISLVLPKMKELFPQFKDITEEQMYKAVNKVSPGLIRIDADELTYSLHIMVRYEIEKMLIEGDLSVDELPSVWNEKMKEYLGVEVPNYKDGVLQDSHWSSGSFGYFPSYALGSAYGAQLIEKMKETVDPKAQTLKGDLSPVVGWLREHIFRFGKMYAPGDLLEKACEAPFDPSYYTRYLENKFRDIYNI